MYLNLGDTYLEPINNPQNLSKTITKNGIVSNIDSVGEYIINYSISGATASRKVIVYANATIADSTTVTPTGVITKDGITVTNIVSPGLYTVNNNGTITQVIVKNPTLPVPENTNFIEKGSVYQPTVLPNVIVTITKDNVIVPTIDTNSSGVYISTYTSPGYDPVIVNNIVTADVNTPPGYTKSGVVDESKIGDYIVTYTEGSNVFTRIEKVTITGVIFNSLKKKETQIIYI